MIRYLRDESGYSMVEVIVALMILSLAILPMVSMFDAGLRAASTGSNYDKARTLANDRLEGIRLLPYNEPGGAANSVVERHWPGTSGAFSTGSQGIFTYTVTSKFFNYAPGGGALTPVNPDPATGSTPPRMMRVAVTVTWGASNSYTTTGFVVSGAGT